MQLLARYEDLRVNIKEYKFVKHLQDGCGDSYIYSLY